MTTKTDRYHIDIRGISVEVVRKDIKNLHIGVYPPKRSRPSRRSPGVSTIPLSGWQSSHDSVGFDGNSQHSQSKTGNPNANSSQARATILAGRRYRLDVIERDAPPKVWLPNNTKITLSVRPGSDRDTREAVLHRWYRQHLRAQLPPLLEKWEAKVGVSVNEVRIKKMKTLWGSCNIEAKRIWLNLETRKETRIMLGVYLSA